MKKNLMRFFAYVFAFVFLTQTFAATSFAQADGMLVASPTSLQVGEMSFTTTSNKANIHVNNVYNHVDKVEVTATNANGDTATVVVYWNSFNANNISDPNNVWVPSSTYSARVHYYWNDSWDWETSFNIPARNVVNNGGGNGINITLPSAPNANDDYPSTYKNTSKLIDVLANDSDADNDPLVPSVLTAPLHGTAVVEGTKIRYTPAPGYLGNDSFEYTISDGTGRTDDAHVYISVTNAAPDAVNDSATDSHGKPITISVLVNDINPDNDPLTITIDRNPGKGRVAVVGNTIVYTPNSDYAGTDSFKYMISDGVDSDIATVSITYTNAAPDAVDDSVSASHSKPITISVLTNDINADNDPLTITIFSNPGKGQVVVAGSTIVYTPNSDYTGTDSFKYMISDGLAWDKATVSITYTNATPVAVADATTTLHDRPVTVPVLSNDSDPDTDPISISAVSVTASSHGTARINGNGIDYTPALGYVGSATFTYTITDGKLTSAPATVTIEVTNRAPVAVADVATTVHGNQVTINVLGNDSDADLDSFSITTFTAASHGTASKSGTEMVYAPASGYVGTDSFTYTISDGISSATATVTINVTNTAPVAVADTATTVHGKKVSINVKGNDSDADADSLSITAVTAPSHGTAIQSSTGIDYTPVDGFAGTDSFTYTIFDGFVSSTATVTITVTNAAPVAADDTATTVHGKNVTINVLDNDGDADADAYTITTNTAPSNGTVSKNSTGFVYTPAAGFVGTDTFEYTISDGIDTGTATVTITVTNAAPVAADDTATTVHDKDVTINVVDNDSDADADSFSITTNTAPSNGTVSKNSTGFVYTPDAGFVGTDTFEYTISDGIDTDTATVTITVTNAAPLAADDTATTLHDKVVTIDVTDNDSDADADSFSITNVTAPSNGTASKSGNQIVYTPDEGFVGTDTFEYTISDGIDTGTAMVTITVTNAAPLAADDTATTLHDKGVTIDVTDNDSDADTDSFSITSVTAPSNGTASKSGNQIVYTPTEGFVGTDTFEYTISDGIDAGTATVTITVTNAAPVAVDDTASTLHNKNVTINVLGNDSDADTDSVSITNVTAPSNGTASISGNQIVYTPATGYVGADSFDYTISDGIDEVTATVTINVTNTAPLAADDAAATLHNKAVIINVLDNDSDADSDPMTLSLETAFTSHGQVKVVGSTIVYTPIATYVGTDSFTYVLSDGVGGTDTATVTIAVTNSAPVAIDDTVTTAQNTDSTISVLSNDSDADKDVLAITSTTAPTNGTVTISGSTITYKPTAGFSGTDSFTYTVSDDFGGTATAKVNITVTYTQPTYYYTGVFGYSADADSTVEISDTLSSAVPPTGDIPSNEINAILLMIAAAALFGFYAKRKENN